MFDFGFSKVAVEGYGVLAEIGQVSGGDWQTAGTLLLVRGLSGGTRRHAERRRALCYVSSDLRSSRLSAPVSQFTGVQEVLASQETA